MNNIKDDKYYVEKTIENINIIQNYTKGKTFDELMGDQQLLDAVMFRLVQMAENIKGLSPQYRDERPKIRWGQIIGFRNGVVHEYGKTDYTIVYEILTSDLDELKESISK